MLVLPGEKYIAEMLDQADVHAIRRVRESLADRHRRHLRGRSLLEHYRACDDAGEYRLDADAIAARRLKNVCLALLMHLQTPEYFELCRAQFDQADNMTDQMSLPARNRALSSPATAKTSWGGFTSNGRTRRWWSTSGSPRRARVTSTMALGEIKPLFEHPAYTLNNPNRARSLLGALIANSSAFHQPDGAGYEFAADRSWRWMRLIRRLPRASPIRSCTGASWHRSRAAKCARKSKHAGQRQAVERFERIADHQPRGLVRRCRARFSWSCRDCSISRCGLRSQLLERRLAAFEPPVALANR